MHNYSEQVAAQIDRIEEPEQQQNISACVEVLASLKFDRQLIRQYLREDIMQEAPLYQEIIQEGMKRGKLELVLRLLNRRIGAVSPALQSQIQGLSITQLDALSEALLDFSAQSDLATWLQTQE
ncbi:hypothetical protein A6770_07715 [Nostoc minutum NIES-26]|uniref:DUF4351 domain-containing protein n=1 Tax=Nostoc minutum NIES-26 TaxID=1844469 RepID=A0A367S1W9_9NOSO|nr:hypothetical protein A6770_07715 [Nostoc minutum NIES-26]